MIDCLSEPRFIHSSQVGPVKEPSVGDLRHGVDHRSRPDRRLDREGAAPERAIASNHRRGTDQGESRQCAPGRCDRRGQRRAWRMASPVPTTWSSSAHRYLRLLNRSARWPEAPPPECSSPMPGAPSGPSSSLSRAIRRREGSLSLRIRLRDPSARVPRSRIQTSSTAGCVFSRPPSGLPRI